MSAIRVLEIVSNPALDIHNLGERVTRRLPARIELREADAKADFVDVGVGDDVVGGRRDRRVDEQLDQALCGKCPAFGVSIDKGLGVAKCFGEGDYGRFAIGGTGELLCVGKDDGEVELLEDSMMN